MFTLKKGAMPIPELTSGCIMGDLVVLYIFTPKVAHEDKEKEIGEDVALMDPVGAQTNALNTKMRICFSK